jgi:hypothetical protein
VLGTGSVGVEENTSDFSFSVYPNPVSDGQNVMLEYTLSEVSRVSYSVFTIEGKAVLQEMGHVQLAGQHRASIDVSKLPPAAYIIQVQLNEAIYTERLIISN